jgi:hypothetical protein
LAELNREAAEHASVLAGLDAAIKTATVRLEKAREAEALKADRAVATEVKKVAAEFVARASRLDELARST